MMKYYGLIDEENKGYGFLDEEDTRVTDEMIKISDEDWSNLLEEQSEGKEIVCYDGNVFTAEPGKYYVDETGVWQQKSDADYEAEQAKKERERLDLLSLTKREVFLALYKSKGLTPEQIRASITDTEALIEFDYANEYYRGNPLINAIGEQLGYTVDELDYLFQNKELPQKDVPANPED